MASLSLFLTREVRKKKTTTEGGRTCPKTSKREKKKKSPSLLDEGRKRWKLGISKGEDLLYPKKKESDKNRRRSSFRKVKRLQAQGSRLSSRKGEIE